MAGSTPPAGSEEAGAGGSFDVFQMGDRGVVRVRAESILLAVGLAEDVVAQTLETEDDCDVERTQDDGVDREISGLEAVDEWNPD